MLVACFMLGGCVHLKSKPRAVVQAAADQQDVTGSITLATPQAQMRQPPPDDPSCGWRASQLEALTLSAAITRSICANPRVAESMHGVRAEVAQYQTTLTQFLPSVVASSQRAISYNSSTSAFGASEDRLTGNSHSVAINWLVWDFGGRVAQTRAASHTALAAMASEDATIQATIAATSEAFMTLQTALELQKAHKLDVAGAEIVLDVAKARLASGGGTPLDVEFALVNLSQIRMAGVRLREQISIARGELATSMNLEPDTTIQLDAEEKSDPLGPATGAPSEIAALLRDLERHPEIRAAQERAAAAEQQIAIVRAEMLPKISAVGNYYYGGRPGSSVGSADTRERFFGLTLSLPLTASLTEFVRMRGARAQSERSQAQVDDTRKRVQSALWKNWQVTQTSADLVRNASVVENHASSALRQAETRYRNGAADNSEWIRAYKSAAEARADRIKETSEARAARIRLLLSLGRLAPWRLGAKMPVRLAAERANRSLRPTPAHAAAPGSR
jgi:outer membrane protein